MFVTYVLQCSDGSFYTGWTNNLPSRLHAHNSGTGAKYTQARRPVKLIASWHFNNRSEAMKREAAIKKLTRKQKLLLLAKAPSPDT